MAEVSLSCTTIGESGSFCRCDDRIIEVNWPSFWGSLMFAVPLAALGAVAAAVEKAVPYPEPRQSGPAAL